MSKLRLVTKEEGELLAITAGEWLGGPTGYIFGDSKTIAKYAVMEFLANEAGLTMYPSVIEKQEQEASNDSA